MSALITPFGNASRIVAKIHEEKIEPCYDYRILEEYNDVLMRSKFDFDIFQVATLIGTIHDYGMYVFPFPLPDADIKDESDRPFYEAAKYCNAPLVTGNIKHFPDDPLVMSLADFCASYLTE